MGYYINFRPYQIQTANIHFNPLPKDIVVEKAPWVLIESLHHCKHYPNSLPLGLSQLNLVTIATSSLYRYDIERKKNKNKCYDIPFQICTSSKAVKCNQVNVENV